MSVDSGSSHSFLSENLARRLQGVKLVTKAMKVRVANGGQLWCTQELSACKWGLQSHKFSSNMKVLQFGCYDVILGMDWLEDNSPMEVNWKLKTLSFVKQGKRITLVGIQPSLDQCKVVDNRQVDKLIQANAVLTMVQLYNIDQSDDAHDVPELI